MDLENVSSSSQESVIYERKGTQEKVIFLEHESLGAMIKISRRKLKMLVRSELPMN